MQFLRAYKFLEFSDFKNKSCFLIFFFLVLNIQKKFFVAASIVGVEQMERTFLAIKPDAVQRGLIGQVIARIERKGFKLVGMKFMLVSKELAEKHYGEHKGKKFFDGLISYITSTPIVAMVWEGKDVIATMRKIMGATNPLSADVGTIRGDFGIDLGRNIIHGSDSPESAKREISLFFNQDELVDGWARSTDEWIYE